jgi:hypothetical protein
VPTLPAHLMCVECFQSHDCGASSALGNLSLDRVFPFPTFLCHLKLFRMTIQQDPYETDPYETDPWWFAPMLYVGLGLAIAGLATAGLHLIVALGVR